MTNIYAKRVADELCRMPSGFTYDAMVAMIQTAIDAAKAEQREIDARIAEKSARLGFIEPVRDHAESIAREIRGQ